MRPGAIVVTLAVLWAVGPASSALASPSLAAGWEHVSAGRLEEAAAAFVEALHRDPGSVEAWIALAQVRRWAGHPEAAEAARAAYALAPSSPVARTELAHALVGEGRPGAARAVLEGHPPDPELAARLERLEAPRVTLFAVASRDSLGVTKVTPRLVAELSLGADVRLRVGGGQSALFAGTAGTHRWLGGATLIAALGGGVVARAGWALHQVSAQAGLLHEGHLQASLRLSPALSAGLSVRRRPFVEPAETLASDEAAFHGAGTFGAFDLPRVAGHEVDEGRLRLGGGLLPGVYFYVDASLFQVSDGNRGWAVPAGAGWDLLTLVGGGPHALVLKWDAYFTGFGARSVSYFSPPFLDSHSPGLSLTLALAPWLRLTASGGVSASLISAPAQLGGPGSGWYAGGGLELSLGKLSIHARAQRRDDPWFRTRAAFLALEYAP